MNFFDNCKNLTVMVGGGSGVLFQPSGEKKYSYVLTAKHNLKDKLVIFKYDGTKLNIQKCYKHETLDIAIIKIEKTDSPEILIQKENPEYLNKYKIYGYPETRQQETEKEEKIFDYDLEITSTSNENYNIDLRNADSSPYEEVVGFSGGGLFNAENTKDARVYLAGIEYQLNNKGNGIEDETHNRIGFISIKAFDEVVDRYSDELVYLDDTKNFNQKYKVNKELLEIIKDGKKLGEITIKTVPITMEDGRILNVSIYPVTFEEYDLFYKENKDILNISNPDCYFFPEKRGKYPVVNVSWEDSIEYCKWLNKKSKNFKYFLPDSSDWENVAKKNIVSENEIDNYVWHKKNTKEIQPVGTTKQGLYGIYDMYGNIYEWCMDSYDGDEELKIIMGNSFNSLFENFSIEKNNYLQFDSKRTLGFRIFAKKINNL